MRATSRRELSASIVLVDALLTQGKQGEAQKRNGSSSTARNKSQNRGLRLQFELASAESS